MKDNEKYQHSKSVNRAERQMQNSPVIIGLEQTIDCPDLIEPPQEGSN